MCRKVTQNAIPCLALRWRWRGKLITVLTMAPCMRQMTFCDVNSVMSDLALQST